MPDASAHYHVELKAFPHVARAFNLDRATLDARFVAPFAAGDAIEFEDRRWPAEKTKLTVLEGPAVERDARGLGRGWGEATRHAHDVTDAVLAEVHRGAAARPEVDALKRALAEVAARTPIGLPDAIALAVAAQPGWRASEQLSLAEQAAWELLHQGGLEMVSADATPIAADDWQAIVLDWGQWSGTAPRPVTLRTSGSPEISR